MDSLEWICYWKYVCLQKDEGPFKMKFVTLLFHGCCDNLDSEVQACYTNMTNINQEISFSNSSNNYNAA